MGHGHSRARVGAVTSALVALLACAEAESDAPPMLPTIEPIELPAPPCASLPPIGPSFVKREGSDLLLDGRKFRAVGANVYYLQQLFAYGEQGNERLAAPAREALDHAVCLSLPVIRTWAFNETTDSSGILSGGVVPTGRSPAGDRRGARGNRWTSRQSTGQYPSRG